MRSLDANNNDSRQQTRPNYNAQLDNEDSGDDSRCRNDSPPRRVRHYSGRDSYDGQVLRGQPLEVDYVGDYPPTPDQHSSSEDGGDNNRQ